MHLKGFRRCEKTLLLCLHLGSSIVYHRSFENWRGAWMISRGSWIFFWQLCLISPAYLTTINLLLEIASYSSYSRCEPKELAILFSKVLFLDYIYIIEYI